MSEDETTTFYLAAVDTQRLQEDNENHVLYQEVKQPIIMSSQSFSCDQYEQGTTEAHGDNELPIVSLGSFENKGTPNTYHKSDGKNIVLIAQERLKQAREKHDRMITKEE